jgi:hypothetical protein
MAFTLFRVDAIYSVPFASPAFSIVGSIPDLLRAAYQVFADRYPGVPISSFKALNSNTLSEVGIAVSLMDGRLEITLRVDQLSVQATNLRTPDETRFAQDCVLLMQDFVTKAVAPSEGAVGLRIASWLRVDGGKEQVIKNLSRIAKPQRATFDPKQIGAENMEYFTKVNFQNAIARWQLTVLAEPAALSDADLYLYRDYQFLPGGEFDNTEKKLGFLEISSLAVYEWLGIGTLKQE